MEENMTTITDLTEAPSGRELSPQVTEGEGDITDTLINNVESDEPIILNADTLEADDTSDTEDDYGETASSNDEDDYINGVTSSTASGPPSPSGEGNDLRELQNQFPALRGIESITELRHPEEYLRFRSLGLTPREALLATGEHPTDTPRAPRVTSPIAVRTRGERIPDYYLKMAREIFGNLSDKEIQALYKKVK